MGGALFPELAIHWWYGDGASAFAGWDAVIQSAARNERLLRPFSREWNARFDRDQVPRTRRIARLRMKEPRIVHGPAPSDLDADGNCRCGCQA